MTLKVGVSPTSFFSRIVPTSVGNLWTNMKGTFSSLTHSFQQSSPPLNVNHKVSEVRETPLLRRVIFVFFCTVILDNVVNRSIHYVSANTIVDPANRLDEVFQWASSPLLDNGQGSGQSAHSQNFKVIRGYDLEFGLTSHLVSTKSYQPRRLEVMPSNQTIPDQITKEEIPYSLFELVSSLWGSTPNTPLTITASVTGGSLPAGVIFANNPIEQVGFTSLASINYCGMSSKYNYLYVSNNNFPNYIQVYDGNVITNPPQISQFRIPFVSPLSSSYTVLGVDCYPDACFVLHQYGLFKLDLTSNPLNPTVSASSSTLVSTGLFIDDTHQIGSMVSFNFVLGGGPYVFTLFNASDPNLAVMNNISLPFASGGLFQIDQEEEYYFIACYNSGLTIVNNTNNILSVTYSAKIPSNQGIPGYANNVVFQVKTNGSTLYTVLFPDGITTFDVGINGNLSMPLRLSSIFPSNNLAIAVYAFAISGSSLFVAQTNQLTQIDASNPSSMYIVAELIQNLNYLNMFLSSQFIYFIDGVGIRVIAPPSISISGTLKGNTKGLYPVLLTAKDSLGNPFGNPNSFGIQVNPAVTVALDSVTLKPAVLNQFFTYSIPGTQFTQFLDNRLVYSAPEAPPGITMSTDGVLSGYPTTSGNYSFPVTATDQALSSATAVYTLPVVYSISTNQPILANQIALAEVPSTIQVSSAVVINPGKLEITHTVTLNGLPINLFSWITFAVITVNGLEQLIFNLNPPSNALGAYQVVVSSQDPYGQSVINSFTLQVQSPTPPLATGLLTLPNANTNENYYQQLPLLFQATYGGVLSMDIVASTLPSCLSYDPVSRLLSGLCTSFNQNYPDNAQWNIVANGLQTYPGSNVTTSATNILTLTLEGTSATEYEIKGAYALIGAIFGLFSLYKTQWIWRNFLNRHCCFDKCGIYIADEVAWKREPLDLNLNYTSTDIKVQLLFTRKTKRRLEFIRRLFDGGKESYSLPYNYLSHFEKDRIVSLVWNQAAQQVQTDEFFDLSYKECWINILTSNDVILKQIRLEIRENANPAPPRWRTSKSDAGPERSRNVPPPPLRNISIAVVGGQNLGDPESPTAQVNHQRSPSFQTMSHLRALTTPPEQENEEGKYNAEPSRDSINLSLMRGFDNTSSITRSPSNPQG